MRAASPPGLDEGQRARKPSRVGDVLEIGQAIDRSGLAAWRDPLASTLCIEDRTMRPEHRPTLRGPKIVIVSRPGEYRRVCQLFGRFGAVEATDYYNVVLLTVGDVDAFISDYLERSANDERLVETISRLLPLQHSFGFSNREEFEQQAKVLALEFAELLEGLGFHVRMHRRGHHNELSAQTEEQFLDGLLLEELVRRGAPGRITFDDPDAILDVETVGDLAGMSLWTRNDLARMPFLHVD